MFGAPKQFGAASPFGQQQQQQQPSFAKPANAFGQPTAFGQQPSMFGSPQQSTGMFGSPQAAAASAFGPTAAPAFGAAPGQAQTGFGEYTINMAPNGDSFFFYNEN